MTNRPDDGINIVIFVSVTSSHNLTSKPLVNNTLTAIVMGINLKDFDFRTRATNTKIFVIKSRDLDKAIAAILSKGDFPHRKRHNKYFVINDRVNINADGR